MTTPVPGDEPGGGPGDEDHRETLRLLACWHQGDAAARDRLIERELPWLRAHVHRRLGPKLRAGGDTEDYVHGALLRVLDRGPRFVSADRSRFRAVLLRIVENHLRDRVDWLGADRRAAAREQPLPSDSVLDLDSRRAATRPSEHAAQSEERAWLQLAMELLPVDDRRVILLRLWHELEFADVARELGIAEDAARMRFHRALPRLARRFEELVKGAGRRGDHGTGPS